MSCQWCFYLAWCWANSQWPDTFFFSSFTWFCFLQLASSSAGLKAISPALMRGTQSELFFFLIPHNPLLDQAEVAKEFKRPCFRQYDSEGLARPLCTLSLMAASFPELLSPAVCSFVWETHFLLLAPCSLPGSDGFSLPLNKIKVLLLMVFSFLTA